MNTLKNIFSVLENVWDTLCAFFGTAFVVLALVFRATVSIYAIVLLWSFTKAANLGMTGYVITIIVGIVLIIKLIGKLVETKRAYFGASTCSKVRDDDPLVKRVKMNEQRYAARQRAAANAARAQQERNNMQ